MVNFIQVDKRLGASSRDNQVKVAIIIDVGPNRIPVCARVYLSRKNVRYILELRG
jgi:hypothetical protein